jgi:hypothetical protein
MALADEAIKELLQCPKIITRRPRREMSVQGKHRKNDFELKSEDSSHTFYAFMRQSTEFPENFTIGLDYTSSPDGARICLLRCNGPHGETVQLPSTPGHHFVCHVHMATAAAIEAGLRPESFTAHTEEFTTFEEAIAYFCSTCNIRDAELHFGFMEAERSRQLRLFEEERDQR